MSYKTKAIIYFVSTIVLGYGLSYYNWYIDMNYEYSHYPWWEGMTGFLFMVFILLTFILGVLNLMDHFEDGD